jgi:DNA-binding SARP family transcriptional activator/Tfp pilus assembly protein PilF
MRIGELRWVLRQSGVLGEAGGDPAPDELADALWLAALRRSNRPMPAPADDLPTAANALGGVERPGATASPWRTNQPERTPPPQVPDQPPPDSRTYATLPVRGAQTPGVLVSVAAKPQLPNALPLARAMRELRNRVPSATRHVLDEERTAELRAEQQLWLPALIPDSEPAFDLALVVDDSESMTLWGEQIREFRLLCERIGAFRDVRHWRLGTSDDAGQARPVLRGLTRSARIRDDRELVDPSGRRLILVVTDGVHPWWRSSGPLRPVLARWALASPLAIVQPFPQRLWGRSPLRPVTETFQPGWPGSGPTLRRAGSGHSFSGRVHGTVAVPILELSPAAMRRWARIISGSSGATPLPAALLPRAGIAGDEPPATTRNGNHGNSGAADPVRLVREFRASVSAAAYQLAGYLSAAPLTLPVMRLVQDSMMPGTGPAELAEVFLSGLLLKSDDTDPMAGPDSATYVFSAGVRDVLQSTLTKGEALSVLDQVGGYLVRGRRGGRPFPVLLQAQLAEGDILAATEQFPASFGRISGMLLERIGGPYADAIRQLARPERAVLVPSQEKAEPEGATRVPRGDRDSTVRLGDQPVQGRSDASAKASAETKPAMFRILGPLEVRAEGTWQPVTAVKWRSLLACLLLKAGQVVSADSLVDEIWGSDPPTRAKNLISIYVLRLRRLLGDADGKLLAYRAPGYVLSIAEGDLDSRRFESLVADGRQALDNGDPVRAAALLSAALGLWRGPCLADVPPTPLIETYTERAAEMRLAASELWAQAAMESDRHDEAITELRRLGAEHPLRESLWQLLIRVLDAAGRRAEALEAYVRARDAFGDELGVDPSPELRNLYAQLLAADAGTKDPARTDAASAEERQPESTTPNVATGTAAHDSYLRPAAASEALQDPVPRPAQLPADIGDFAGREEQIQHLYDVLTSGGNAGPDALPIAFITGAGGLGKTTLAVHAAHLVRDQFPDGQLYVDLLGATPQPLPPGDVLATFLRDLGVQGSKIPADDEERAALYRTRLTGRRVLIVLDNARDAAQVRPLLPGSASCAVLVTTRLRSADLASTRFIDLNVLDDDAALALFTRILGDERALAEPEATAEVLVACAGLPLAIRICAARLAARGHWKIATMARRLRDERRRLDELAIGDLAVRASFQVSYDSLGGARYGADPKRAFRLLGLWQGPSISLRAAAALYGSSRETGEAVAAGVGEVEIADALESLVDAHLLESPEPDWYRFHDLLRVYATERVRAEDAESDRAAAQERLLRWYLHTADGAAQVVAPHRYQIPLQAPQEPYAAPAQFDTAEMALDWYDSERTNVVAATRQAAQAGLHDIAWRLPTGLFPLFNRRDIWTDVIVTHRIALDSVLLTGNRMGEGWVRNNLGVALARVRDPEALEHLEQALSIRRDLGDLPGEVQAAISLGEAYFIISGPHTALEPDQVALAAARAAGTPSLLSLALNNLGEVYIELGRLDEAEECFREVRDVSASSDAYGQAYALHNLGRVYVELGRPQEAIASLREALRLHERTGDMNGEATAYRYLGRAYHAAGAFESARESWTAALEIFHQVGRESERTEMEAALAGLP